MHTAQKLRACLIVCVIAACSHNGHTQTDYTGEPQYIVACRDKEAIDALRTTFLARQWVMVPILVGKQGMGSCILHDINDPTPLAMVGKYTLPLRPPPRGMFVNPWNPNKPPGPPRPWMRPPKPDRKDSG